MKRKVLSGRESPKASDVFLGRSAPSEAGEMNQASREAIRRVEEMKWKMITELNDEQGYWTSLILNILANKKIIGFELEGVDKLVIYFDEEVTD